MTSNWSRLPTCWRMHAADAYMLTLSLQEYKEKVENVAAAKTQLELHIKSLPDLSQLPDENAGLAPLPSAGDLFSL